LQCEGPYCGRDITATFVTASEGIVANYCAAADLQRIWSRLIRDIGQ